MVVVSPLRCTQRHWLGVPALAMALGETVACRVHPAMERRQDVGFHIAASSAWLAFASSHYPLLACALQIAAGCLPHLVPRRPTRLEGV